jgi:DNA-binding NarL/FixJ family response regulator
MARAEEPNVNEMRAVVIEGQPLVRAGITSVLREHHVAVVAEVSSSTEAANLVRGADAHLVVVGDAGDGAGLARVVERVKARNQGVRIVALVPRCTRDELLSILDAGADAIVPHDVERDELITAVTAVRSGGRHMAPSLTNVLFAALPSDVVPVPVSSTGVLTHREHDIVNLLAEGCTNDEIGKRLYISAATVKTHLSNAYSKLGARNRYDAVVKATQLGLL